MLLSGRSTIIRNATIADRDSIAQLLDENGLPTSDLSTNGITGFMVAEDDDGPAGVIGLEKYGEIALLRSLCTRVRARGKGIARELVLSTLKNAAESGVRKVYLLTETAESFFATQGFSAIDRGMAPEAIQGTSQFQSLCPATAILMFREIP